MVQEYLANKAKLTAILADMAATKEIAQSEVSFAKLQVSNCQIKLDNFIEAAKNVGSELNFEDEAELEANYMYVGWTKLNASLNEANSKLAACLAKWDGVDLDEQPAKKAPKESKVTTEVKELSQKAKFALLADDYMKRKGKTYKTGLKASELISWIISEAHNYSDELMKEYKLLLISKYTNGTKARVAQDMGEHIAAQI